MQLQINISRGIKFHLLGIPARPGNEIRNRVYTALRSNGWRWPGQRITIQCEESLVPIRQYELDLAIALGILALADISIVRRLVSTPIALENHRQRFQAALRDRFDICLPITAPRQKFEAAETSAQIKRRVHLAWSIQMSRLGKQNAQLSEEEILLLGLVPNEIYQWLVVHCVESRISIRGRRQLLSVALTIMDLEGKQCMHLSHLQEALLMRD